MKMISMNDRAETKSPHSRRNWEKPVIVSLGNYSQEVLVGLGKLSPPAVDPGEPKKTQPDG